jgi:signal peptidase I
MLTLNLLKFTDTKGWIHMAHKQDIQADTEEKTSVGKELFQWVLVIIGAVILAFLIDTFVIVNAQIPSGSMENTIMTGDRVFGNRLAYKFSDPKRFDIIIFKYPDDESQLFIKRIIGLPGETVEIHDGNIYINGSDTPLEDVDIKEPMEGSFGPYTVPEGCYFVMGDNRNNSRDSRYWENTFVSEDEILGKAVLRYWPLNEIKLL